MALAFPLGLGMVGELNNDWSAWGYAFYNGLEGWHSMDYGYGRLAFAVRSEDDGGLVDHLTF